jgi:hypothetical protein
VLKAIKEVQAAQVRLLPFFSSLSEVQTTLSFLLVLIPLRLWTSVGRKYKKLSDIYNFAVEEVVKTYFFFLQFLPPAKFF